MNEVTIKFVSNFGEFTETIEIKTLIAFDYNSIPYEQFLRLNKTQQKHVLYNCAIRFWEHKFCIAYDIESLFYGEASNRKPMCI